ncbi:alpha/beta fold hydrolase [Spirosoma agri]|uniref:Alpha/beta hydrolase n=1 Tax=Spirosoma agri TaxID=1987381 RepID=A0A6M0IFP6_9BACT|nr:alpha/beta hydrolase [Spirosoma agri]NEU66697.1 alpha/beta hydrolase [Spirosoma agri]
MTSTVKHTFVDTNGIQLHVVQAGPVSGPLVILLHGFPEFWYGWRHQIDDLVNAGFCVWVPDQRGYNLSDKPKGVGSYAIDTLAADVVGLIEAAGRQKAILVGHDWGAAVAWWTAVVYPERIGRLVTLNVPHPVVMSKFVRKNPGQILRSWYIGFFQLPWLPERLMRFGDWSALTRTLRTSSRPGTFTTDELSHYKAAWSQPGAFRAMVNWYRASLRFPGSRRPSVRVTVPTLLIWGVQDRFLKREMAPLSIDLCDNGRVVYLEQATHWVQHEEHEWVNKLIRGG